MANVLLVSENPAEVALFTEALAEINLACDLTVMTNCAAAFHYLRVKATRNDIPPPDAIVIDMPMPMDGYDTLIEFMDHSPMFQHVPRLALCTDKAMINFSKHPESLRRVFVQKGFEWERFLDIARMLRAMLDN